MKKVDLYNLKQWLRSNLTIIYKDLDNFTLDKI